MVGQINQSKKKKKKRSHLCEDDYYNQLMIDVLIDSTMERKTVSIFQMKVLT